MTKIREKHVPPNMSRWLVPPDRLAWGEPQCGENLLCKILGESVPPFFSNEARLYLHRSSMLFLRDFPHPRDDLIIVETEKDEPAFLQAKSTVIDRLIELKLAGQTWRTPTPSTLRSFVGDRQMSLDVLRGVPGRKYTIGEDDPKKLEDILEWLLKHHEEAQKSCPTSTMPIKIFKTRITEEQHDLILDPQYAGEEIIVEEAPLSSKFIYLPHKIVLGDGITHAVVIQLNTAQIQDDESGKHKYLVKNTTISDELIEFFKSLPPVTAHDMHIDIEDLEEALRKARPDIKVKMFDTVDLQSLATLCGWADSNMDFGLMCYQLIGAVYPDTFTGKEKFFTKNWEDLDLSLRMITVLTLRYTHYCYTVLLHTLLSHLFPDVDVVTNLTRTTPLAFTDYFSALIVFTLDSTFVSTADSPQNPTSIVELYQRIKSLPNKKMPERVGFFATLWGQWPVLSQGGARYLIQARDFFVYQFATLQTAPIPGFGYIFRVDLSAEQCSFARYGYAKEYLQELDFGLPITDCQLYLVQHPHLKAKEFKFLINEEFSHLSLRQQAAANQRDKRNMIEEWSRYNLERIPHLFDQVTLNPRLIKNFSTFYESLRLTFRNLGSKKPVTIEALEEKYANAIKVEKDITEKKLTLVRDQLNQLKKDEGILVQTLQSLSDQEVNGLQVDRTAYRTTFKEVGSVKVLTKRDKMKTKLHEHNQQFRFCKEDQEEDQALAYLESWKDSEELKRTLPTSSPAKKRARSRSATRESAHEHRTISTANPMKKSNSMSRMPRSRSKSSTRRVGNSWSRQTNLGSSTATSTSTRRVGGNSCGQEMMNNSSDYKARAQHARGFSKSTVNDFSIRRVGKNYSGQARQHSWKHTDQSDAHKGTVFDRLGKHPREERPNKLERRFFTPKKTKQKKYTSTPAQKNLRHREFIPSAASTPSPVTKQQISYSTTQSTTESSEATTTQSLPSSCYFTAKEMDTGVSIVTPNHSPTQEKTPAYNPDDETGINALLDYDPDEDGDDCDVKEATKKKDWD